MQLQTSHRDEKREVVSAYDQNASSSVNNLWGMQVRMLRSCQNENKRGFTDVATSGQCGSSSH